MPTRISTYPLVKGDFRKELIFFNDGTQMYYVCAYLNLFLIWTASACCPHYRINLSSNYLTSLSSRLTKCTALLQSYDHEKWVLCGYNSWLINVWDESCSSLKITLHLFTFAKSWNWMRSGPWIFRLVLNFPQNSSSALEISICHGFHQSNSPPFYSQAKHFAMP